MPLFITLIGVISTIIAASFFLITEKTISYEKMIDLALNYSFISVPLAVFWFLFENYGWRSPFLKILNKPLNTPPNINGRWEGFLIRNGESEKQKFIIEIKQTMTKLQIRTYAEDGVSESIMENIISDKMEEDFQLCFLWEGISESLNTDKNRYDGKFMGYSLLKIVENKDKKKMKGEYFTNRTPVQTKGLMNVKWVSNDLKREF